MLRALAPLFAFVISLSAVECQRYIVPEASLEFLSPRGLKISIPDIDAGVTLVAFHININEEFFALTHGHFAQDIIKKREGKWMYFIPEFRVKKGDTIYYWIYVVVDGLAYHGLDRVYQVTQDNPHGSGGGGLPPTNTPSPSPPGPTPCPRSPSSRNRRTGFCQGEELLNKKFNNLDGWSHEVYIGGNKLEDEFTVFSNDDSVSSVHRENLVIRPVLLEEEHNAAFVRIGHLNLEGCTSTVANECSRQASSYIILPPIKSARLTSKNSFSFRYGTVEIKAKLPRGDWIVPELWLEPVNPDLGNNWGRMVLGMSRGNTDLVSSQNNRQLEAGVVMKTTSQLSQLTRDVRWGQDYHTYKLVWTQDRLEFSVDGHVLTSLMSGSGLKSSFFNEEFYITLGVHVAGGADFPDTMRNKPWKNSDPKRFVNFWEAKSSWHSTWDQSSVLHIESVKVKAL